MIPGNAQLGTAPQSGEEVRDLQSPHREAAFFFGLFLRGHNPAQLREDIDFPPTLLAKWRRRIDPQAPSSEEIQRVFEYRKQVLAIFNFLVSSEPGPTM